MASDQIQLDINNSLKYYLSDPASVPTPEANSSLVDCENDPDALTASLVSSILNPIVDAVAENPEALIRSSTFDSLQFLLKCAPIKIPSQQDYPIGPDQISKLFSLSRSTALLPTHALSKILDLIVSGISAEADVVHNDLETDEQDAVSHHRNLLEAYGFLLQWTVAAVETKAQEKSSVGPIVKGRGSAKPTKPKVDAVWDSSSQLQTALEVMCKVLKLKLSRIFVTTSERDTFVNLCTRPVYLVLESETRAKSTAIRMHAFKVLCIAVKHHGHAFGAQTSIIQNLSYFEHLSEPMAEFLHILAEQYDYPQLADEILRELSGKEFNSNDTRGPKSVASFIIKLSELAPRLILKQMTLLVKHLDSEAYTLRCAIIEVCGNLIADLSKQDERGEDHQSQIDAFFDVLEERFLDTNTYVRSRTIQIFARLCDLETKFPKRRQTAAQLAARSLEDRSSNVRRNAIKLLGRLISTHPFSVMHGGQLAQAEWNTRLKAVDNELSALKPPADSPGLAEQPESSIIGNTTSVTATSEAVEDSLLDDVTQLSPSKPSSSSMATAPPLSEAEATAALAATAAASATSEAIARLQLTRRYYAEALKFIDTLHLASLTIVQLLGSRNKSEVVEAMDFFVVADAYALSTARLGIRRMLRLIWTKGNSDEGKGVQTHLVECYKGLFFEAPDSFSENDAAGYVARNMLSLTFGATPAELTSLEQLLSTMMKQGFVSPAVVNKLWGIYGVKRREISRSQRRGAIIVLGMLAVAEKDVVRKEMETILKIGLGEHGRRDLALARWTCVAIGRIAEGRSRGKRGGGADVQDVLRLANDHPMLVKLREMVETVSDSKEWFGVAEQALGAIYALSNHPDVICAEIVRRKTRYVFQPRSGVDHGSELGGGEPREQTANEDADKEGDTAMETPPPTPGNRPASSEGESKAQKGPLALSQLLFIVGHIAIKQIVHLEMCEMDFKRRKADKEKHKPAVSADNTVVVKKGAAAKKDSPADDLDLIGGTTEDDFTEAMAHIRERELLYGEQSLLSSFGPLCAEICSNNTTYRDRNLQAAATLCMAKLMCVSAEFCEAHLPLLITILERSEDATIRSNVVIALGDMAVCFNHLIDENTDFLYRRLNDRDGSVKRTCLMTLTFLILAGQVKVKGQLGEMAKCLEDSDRRIADLSRMFFSELATKDNAVYNHFVDMFSLLSAEKGLEEDALRRIVKFLASFIEKDKHAKQLADKLAARLARCETERQWSDVAYALSLLQHKNEDIQKTVAAGFRVVEATA